MTLCFFSIFLIIKMYVSPVTDIRMQIFAYWSGTNIVCTVFFFAITSKHIRKEIKHWKSNSGRCQWCMWNWIFYEKKIQFNFYQCTTNAVVAVLFSKTQNTHTRKKNKWYKLKFTIYPTYINNIIIIRKKEKKCKKIILLFSSSFFLKKFVNIR